MEQDFEFSPREVALINEPMRRPRKGTPGEVVFAEGWKSTMSHTPDEVNMPNAALHGVLRHIGHELNQRSATVAASLITYLGTQGGASLLAEARRLAKSGHYMNVEDAYLAAWSVENARRSYTSGGVRTLEYCMTPEENFKDMRPGTSQPGVTPAVSAEDLEVADDVMRWLATGAGQQFLGYCEGELERRRPVENMRFHLKNNLNLPDHEVERILGMAQKLTVPA